ncbi:hypothetical protein [Urbifossiella limnaea]|uniref:hypothetical protein n=1 Tax=Urbifossiella limnaea TaxID=2528023 RepID=UPI0011A1C0E6|nr:hypothetical protein [Urbifossiella limnaea]
MTVTRWRLYSPAFRAALAERRAAVWGAAADRLRAVLSAAVDALADALNDPDHPARTAVALAVLKLAGPLPVVPAEPTDPDEVVRELVEAKRDRLRERSDDLNALDGLPGYDAHERAVRKRLVLLAGPPDPPAALPAPPPAICGGTSSPAAAGNRRNVDKC